MFEIEAWALHLSKLFSACFTFMSIIIICIAGSLIGVGSPLENKFGTRFTPVTGALLATGNPELKDGGTAALGGL
jgi:hypothetical protein